MCTACTQEFTRLSTAKRHNINLHRSEGYIVRILEYIIGTLEGRYPRPEPLLHKHRNRMSTKEYYQLNLNYTTQFNPFAEVPSPKSYLSQVTNTTFNNRPSSYNKLQEALSKVLEIRKLLSKYLSPQKIKVILAGAWSTYIGTRDCALIDENLAWARTLVGLVETNARVSKQCGRGL
jgi:hypothetical protein